MTRIPYRDQRGGPRPGTGGARAGAGRPRGTVEPRLDPEATRAALLALVPAEDVQDGAPVRGAWARLARRIGVRPGDVREALRSGMGVRRFERWKAALGRV